jgi:hypothetical protein
MRYNFLNLNFPAIKKEKRDYEEFLSLMQRAKNVPEGFLDYDMWLWAYGILYRSEANVS